MDHPRQVVIAIGRPEAKRLNFDDPTGILDRPDTSIIPIPLEEDAPQWQRDLERRRQLTLNTVLIQDPMHPGVYFSAGDADWQIAAAKATVFVELCQLLGASRVTVTLVKVETRSGHRDIKIKGGRPVGPSASLSSTDDRLAKVRAAIEIDDTYVGGPARVEAAQALLLETGLDGDHSLSSLVRSRGNESNQHLERTLNVNLSTEATRTLTAAASLSVPLYFSLDTNLKTVSSEAAQFMATYKVTF